MKIKIEGHKSVEFHLKRERILIPPTPPSEGDAEIQSVPLTASDPEVQESSEKKKKERKYSYTYSRPRTKMLFNEILSQVPRWKGAVVIYGDDGATERPIELIHSSDNLRETFSKQQKSLNGTMVDRFGWMEGILQAGAYKKLKIYITRSF